MTGRGGWRHDVGRRGASLLVVAAAEIGYGWGLAAGHTPEVSAADSLMPFRSWGIVWIIAGAVAAAAAFSPADQAGFAAAALMTFFWATLAVTDWITDRHPGGFADAALPVAVTGLILIISGWPEPPP